MAERSYDYPAKNAVRRAWMRFLPPDLSNATGLYLPAEENLELPFYLERGMSPSRLIGAEHDMRRFDRVQTNKGGINLVSGGIKEAVAFIEERHLFPIQFANLDFDGNSHTFIEELVALARIFPRIPSSYLAITSYAARDRGALIQGTVNANKFHSGLPSSVFLQGFGRMLARFETLVKLIPKGESTALSHFQRELGQLWWIVLMFAISEPKEDGRFGINKDFMTDSGAILDVITARVQRQLEITENETDLVFAANHDLRELLVNREVAVWITNMQSYAYWSANRQPMRTWFFRVDYLEPGQRQNAQELLRQVWNLALNVPLRYIDSEGRETIIT